MSRDALIGVTDLGNLTTGRQPEVDASITEHDIPEPQPVPEKLVINEKASMENLLEVIRLLGESNRQAGFQAMAADTALSADRIAKGDYENRRDLKGAASFLEGADERRRTTAFQKYERALKNATGQEIPHDDLALLVGWKLFSAEYGAKGEAAQAHRKEARDLIEEALQTYVVIAPIETYYDPDKYGLASVPDYSQLPQWSLLEGDDLLTDADKKLLPDMGATRAAFLAVRESKGNKIIRERYVQDDNPLSGLNLDELAEANTKAVEVVNAGIDKQVKELDTVIKGINVSWNAVYQFLVAANPASKESFRITSDRVNIILKEVVPDVAELITAKIPNITDEDKDGLHSYLARSLFSLNLESSHETANRILGILTDRKKVLQEDIKRYSEFKDIVQHWADTTITEVTTKTKK